MEIPRLIAKTATSLGITNFIHVSALNADHNSPSAFLRSKVKNFNKFLHPTLFPFRWKVKKQCVMPAHLLS